MGKRNLAIVGTHKNFFADIYDETTGRDPSIVTGCASAEDAATSYFKSIFENSNAMIRAAAVAVWPAALGPERMTVFDAEAVLTPSKEADAEHGEYDVFLDVRQRP